MDFIFWFIFLVPSFNHSVTAARVYSEDRIVRNLGEESHYLSQLRSSVNVRDSIEARTIPLDIRAKTSENLQRREAFPTRRVLATPIQVSLPVQRNLPRAPSPPSQQSLPSLEQCEAALKPGSLLPDKSLFGKEYIEDSELGALQTYATRHNLQDVCQRR